MRNKLLLIDQIESTLAVTCDGEHVLRVGGRLPSDSFTYDLNTPRTSAVVLVIDFSQGDFLLGIFPMIFTWS